MGRKGYERVSQREYAKILGISNEAVSRAVKEGRIKKGWDPDQKKIIVQIADREFGLLHKHIEIEIEQKQATDQPQTSSSLQLNGNSSYADAKRIKEIILAQLAALDLKERKAELVNKDEVHKQLFGFGQHLRVKILSIPDRIIDNLLASKSRAEAHNQLLTALHETLESLTAFKLDITSKET